MWCGEVGEIGLFWLIIHNYCLSGQAVIGFVHQFEVHVPDKYKLKEDSVVGCEVSDFNIHLC